MKKRRVTSPAGGGYRDGCEPGTRFGFRIARSRGARAALRDWPLLALIAGFGMIGSCAAVGYSYTRFEGPVVGPEQLVPGHDGRTVDYVARPEYSFAYGVEDGKTRVLQNRKETRNGDEVRGVYR